MSNRFGVATNSSGIDAKRADNFLQADFPLLIPSQDRLLPVADGVDMICGQANSAAIERPVQHNSTLPMAEGPYAKCWLSCIAGLA
jgi:hypothetical protein